VFRAVPVSHVLRHWMTAAVLSTEMTHPDTASCVSGLAFVAVAGRSLQLALQRVLLTVAYCW
jgi:hypothetical protein